jgi:hypothetical protein
VSPWNAAGNARLRSRSGSHYRRSEPQEGSWGPRNAIPRERQPKNCRAHAHVHVCVFLRSLRSFSMDLEIKAGQKACRGGTQTGTQQERSVPGARPPPEVSRDLAPHFLPLLPSLAATTDQEHQ